MKTQTLIEQLGLEPLPGEGGFFKRVHSFMKEDRLLGSVIYYLITEESYSSLHYLSTDEVWFFFWKVIHWINWCSTATEVMSCAAWVQ